MIISNLSKNIISKNDIIFLNKAIKYFKIKNKKISIHWNNSKLKHPDIWVTNLHTLNPQIFVTQEWFKQHKKERRKRLVHELYHIAGHHHWKQSKLVSTEYLKHILKINKLPSEFMKFKNDKNYIQLMYSTYPDEDSYSWLIYYKIYFSN